MLSDDISQIRVGKLLVGITGLELALREVALSCSDQPEKIITAELVERLAKKNYIPESAQEAYGEAFYREYRRFQGEEIEEEVPEDIDIKVIGTGCAAYERLAMHIRDVLAEAKYPFSFEQIIDLNEINKHGGTPVLKINNEVVSVGKVLSRNSILDLFEKLYRPQQQDQISPSDA